MQRRSCRCKKSADAIDPHFYVTTIRLKTKRIRWEEQKRQSNLEKHGLDFRDADWVLESRYRLDVPVVRNDEMRLQSFAYVFEVFTVLSLAHAERDREVRIISFRKASAEEREMYYEWLENDFTD